ISSPFPYTTLFRSQNAGAGAESTCRHSLNAENPYSGFKGGTEKAWHQSATDSGHQKASGEKRTGTDLFKPPWLCPRPALWQLWLAGTMSALRCQFYCASPALSASALPSLWHHSPNAGALSAVSASGTGHTGYGHWQGRRTSE